MSMNPCGLGIAHARPTILVSHYTIMIYSSNLPFMLDYSDLSKEVINCAMGRTQYKVYKCTLLHTILVDIPRMEGLGTRLITHLH